MAPMDPPAFPPPTAPPPPQSDDNVWALLGDLSIFVIPVIGGLIVFLVAGRTRPWLREQGASILNFQLTMLIASIVGVVLILVLVGFAILLAVAVVSVVFPIIAAVNHGQGRAYRYPVAIPFVS